MVLSASHDHGLPQLEFSQENEGHWRDGHTLRANSSDVGQIVEREVRLRFEGVMDALERRAMSQAEIDALPRRYKLIAVERGTLRALNDGSYVAWPDASMMGEDELQAHRERVQQLIADGLL